MVYYAINDFFSDVYLLKTEKEITPQEMTAIISGWQQGAYSKQTMYEMLVEGEMINEGLTFEEEQARVEDGQPLGGQ